MFKVGRPFAAALLCSILVVFSTACGGGGGSTTTPSPNPSPISTPAPNIASLSPTSATAGSVAPTLTVNGSGFINTSSVKWNGSDRATTFVSSTQLTAALTQADLAAAGTVQVTVTNPGSGGGTSSAATFAINNPSPVVTGVSPSTITTSDAGAVLKITGTGFMPSTVIAWNGTQRTTTFVSSTQLQTTILASDVGSVGAARLAAINPTPGGGASTALPVPIQYAVPSATSLVPSAASSGGAAFTLAVNGSGFVPASIVRWNGVDRVTTFVSSVSLKAAVSATDIAASGTANVSVYTPTPGGGSASALLFAISAPVPVPAVNSVIPSSSYAVGSDTPITVYGTGFVAGSTIQWNGSDLTTSFINGTQISGIIPAADLTAVGTNSIKVRNPTVLSGGGLSNGTSFSVLANPGPTVSAISPSGTAIGSANLTLTVLGSGFMNSSVIRWTSGSNTSDLATQYVNDGQLTATVPSTALQTFGTVSVSVFTPSPGGGTSSSLPFSTYLAIPNKNLVYNSVDGLLYLSVPSSAGPTLGNSVVSVDPATGVIGTPIWVGSEPGKLAISSDGTALWVALDGASSVRKVNLASHSATAVQFYLPGNSHTGLGAVSDMAVLPGSTNSVAVDYSGVISIWDGTVKRANTGCGSYSSNLAFGASASKVYATGSNYTICAVDSSGIASSTSTSTSSYNAIRFDSGRVYLSTGAVLNADTGALLGTFASGGPMVPDSAVNRAFTLSFDRITAFELSTFVSAGFIPVAGVASSANPSTIVRWGKDGLAFRTDSQLFIVRSSLVRDLSSTKSDIGVTVVVPSTATTGSSINYNLTVRNSGPNPATNVGLVDNLPDAVIFASATPSQGTCSGANVLRCNLGTIASGGAATLQVVVKPTTSGSVTAHATVSATELDPSLANNSVDATTTVTGSAFNPVPQVVSISPSLLKAGSGTTTITVSGSGFTPSSTVRWNNTDLATQFGDATTLTATLDSNYVSAMGWGLVSVSTSTPGGGTSSGLPLTVYTSVALDTNSVVFDPFTRKIWASVPGTATQAAGNSLVAIDPTAATVGTPISIGSEPRRVALSDDGQYLYTVLSGSKEVRRLYLPTLTPGTRFTTTDYYNNSFSADDLSVMPGNHDALATSGYSSAIQVWDVSGASATKRANAGSVYAGVFLNWTDSSHLFSYDSGLSPSKLHRFSVGATSATEADATNVTWFAGRFTPYQQTPTSKYLLYSDAGGVIDPSPVSPNPPQLVGHYANSGSLALESGAGRVFTMNTNAYYYSSASPTLSVFDQYSFLQLGAVPLPLNSGDTASDLIRWGQDGLAFRKYQGSSSLPTAGTGEIIMMRGPLVVPQFAMNNTQPAATLISPSSIAAGSSNTYLTVTGSGFVPGAIVLWNGQARTTSFINGTTLKAAVTASDLAVSGTVSVTVANPNSAASTAVTLTVN